MMNHAFNRFLPNDVGWRNLFEMVIVSARKPEFFQLSHPLYEVVTDDGLMCPCFKAVELMLVDALIEANDYLGISLHAHDPEDFWKLDDTIIKTIETAPNNELKKAKEIIQRIRRRELYKKSSEVLPKEEDVAVSNVKIDLTRGKDNPLERFLIFECSSQNIFGWPCSGPLQKTVRAYRC
ncbi:HD domain-containing metal-dependent phosphohydrolase family protein [Zea mays]|uniref:HD domain-containing metal-dependent phosphohydrolase family protein n=1 Tax=Zea mays TaxID=4577 RepID=A0A1D6GM40_MAIZE|nr:HD domain-containing metal-dependent phosphohydrolase family protein [Zea mays]AQK64376.1 HD domain-containing metal-dependent phosphohydrolase family protein [Zea mays]